MAAGGAAVAAVTTVIVANSAMRASTPASPTAVAVTFLAAILIAYVIVRILDR